MLNLLLMDVLVFNTQAHPATQDELSYFLSLFLAVWESDLVLVLALG